MSCFRGSTCMFCFIGGHPFCFVSGGHPVCFVFGGHPICFALGGHPLCGVFRRSPCMFCFRRSPCMFCFRRSPCMFCFTAAIIHFPAMASESSISLLINNYATELSRGIITVLGRHGKQFRKMSIWWLHYLKIIKIFTPWLHIFCVQRCL